LSCDFFGKVWSGVYVWLGLTTVHPAKLSDHLLPFGSIGDFCKESLLCSSLNLAYLRLNHLTRKKFKSFQTKGGMSSSSSLENKVTIFLVAKDKSLKFCF